MKSFNSNGHKDELDKISNTDAIILNNLKVPDKFPALFLYTDDQSPAIGPKFGDIVNEC